MKSQSKLDREQVIIELIIKEKEKGISNSYFAKLCKLKVVGFSKFMHKRVGMSEKRLIILESFFGINKKV